MKFENICTPETKTDANGNEKTFWNKVGVMFIGDDGKKSIKLAMFPELKLYCFPPKPRDTSAPDDSTPF